VIPSHFGSRGIPWSHIVVGIVFPANLKAMLFAVVCVSLVVGSSSQSVATCGAAGDHFSNVKITLSPDPPQLGQPFSFDITGDLDEILDGGNADVDLNVKALGIVNEPVQVSAPFTFSPGAPSGLQSITVGPVNLPKIPLPGGVVVNGTVKLTNTKKEPVACLKLALKVGGAERGELAEGPVATSTPVTSCTQPSDHMKNFAFSQDTSGMTTIQGTLDEDLDKMTVAVDLNIKIPLIPLPAIDVKVPISYSPGIKKGDVKATFGPSTSQLKSTPISVNGTVKINDGNSEEVVCIDITSTGGQHASTVVV